MDVIVPLLPKCLILSFPLPYALQARELYGSVCELQPLASQGWLEWAKMEEECGQVKFSLKILREGLCAAHSMNVSITIVYVIHRSDRGTQRIIAALDIKLPFTAIALHYLNFLVTH